MDDRQRFGRHERLGRHPGAAGFSAGTGVYGQYYELPQSGSQSSMLALPDTDGNLGGHGVWQFRVSNGTITGIGGANDDTLTGTISGDFMDGGAGNDLMRGLGGNDFMYGRAGNDSLDGGAGNDFLDGGDGSDVAFYTAIAAPSPKDDLPAVPPAGAPASRCCVDSQRRRLGTACRRYAYGTDTLVNIERIQLADGSFILDVTGSQSVLV